MQTLNHHVGYSRENECWFVRFYPYQTEQQANDAVSAFTRPAAPVNGLETVETQMRCLLQTGNHQWRNPRLPNELSFIKANGKDETGIPYEIRELVTRSQTEAIIAAKDKQIEAYGLALMMIGEGCGNPSFVARNVLERFGK